MCFAVPAPWLWQPLFSHYDRLPQLGYFLNFMVPPRGQADVRELNSCSGLVNNSLCSGVGDRKMGWELFVEGHWIIFQSAL